MNNSDILVENLLLFMNFIKQPRLVILQPSDSKSYWINNDTDIILINYHGFWIHMDAIQMANLFTCHFDSLFGLHHCHPSAYCKEKIFKIS